MNEGDEPGARRKPRWKSEEEVSLRELWGTMKDAEIALAIGKTVSAIRCKAGQLLLRDEKGRRIGCRPGTVSYPWSRDEDLVLIKNVGHMNLDELVERLPRRSVTAIRARCYELGFKPCQGTYSRMQIERDTGYDWRQIRRARDAIGQVWKRYGLRKYMITFDQVQEIIAYLRDERRKWALHYNLDACIKCGASGFSEKERHSGDGLCKSCWDSRRYNRKRAVDMLWSGRGVVLTEELWQQLADKNE